MIELTKEEAIDILKELSRIEGYLLGLANQQKIIETCNNSIELLTKKILKESGEKTCKNS